jgi:Reverse transcriptase (RNA-dependent DNA polymerase)
MVSEHRYPRGIESARTGLGLTRAERVNPARVRHGRAGMRAGGGRPTAMGAELRLAGQGAQEANAGGGNAVILDRCHQARVRHALEPEWEARFEPRSYGFRPGRGCHDAIESLFQTLCGKSKRAWILDADLAGAFDNIGHDHLLAAIGDFPARRMVADWLKAGIFEAGKGFSPTEAGTPQGGVIWVCLLSDDAPLALAVQP